MAYEVVMSYHLHMPSYFLGTFTEYPFYIPSFKNEAKNLFSLYREQVLRFVLYNGYINRIPLKRISFLRL